MAAPSQSKLIMLAEQGVHVEDCWENSRPYCCRLRMDGISRLCWTLQRSCSPALVLGLIIVNLLVVAFTLAAPTQHRSSSAPITVTTIPTSSPTTVSGENEDAFVHEPPSAYDPTEPRALLFLKNPSCKLHKDDGRTVSRRCGLRELDLPNGNSGVQFWTPQICRSSHCECVATKEFRKREKRTVANNKTMIEYRRFRLFECV